METSANHCTTFYIHILYYDDNECPDWIFLYSRFTLTCLGTYSYLSDNSPGLLAFHEAFSASKTAY